jgi:hypothetical protein
MGRITDASAGDSLVFSGFSTSFQTEESFVNPYTFGFGNILSSMVSGNATKQSKWFRFGDNTYIVQDNSSSKVFVGGVDKVVELVGSIDLSKATLDIGGVLTLA